MAKHQASKMLCETHRHTPPHNLCALRRSKQDGLHSIILCLRVHTLLRWCLLLALALLLHLLVLLLRHLLLLLRLLSSLLLLVHHLVCSLLVLLLLLPLLHGIHVHALRVVTCLLLHGLLVLLHNLLLLLLLLHLLVLLRLLLLGNIALGLVLHVACKWTSKAKGGKQNQPCMPVSHARAAGSHSEHSLIIQLQAEV